MTPADPLPPALSVADVATHLRVAPETVLDWIRAGELRALNVGRGAQRPRWRIDVEALDDFKAGRRPVVEERAPARFKRPPGLKRYV